MAQAGFTPISLYFSSTAAAVPTSGNLANGELALNIADMKLYAKNSAGTVTLLASSGGAAGTVSSVAVSGGTTGLTTSGGPITTSGTITLAGTLATTNGGTNLTSFTSGGVVYASSSSALATGSGLVFDGSNLGLGVTPSAWQSSLTPIQGLGYSLYSATATQVRLSANEYFNAGSIYRSTGVATLYQQSSGQHQFFTAASGTAGDPISFTQAMTLDASGNLGIGLTSPSARLHVRGASGSYTGGIIAQDATGNFFNFFGYGSDGVIGTAGNIRFATFDGSSERARIDSSGNLLVGGTAARGTTAGTKHLDLFDGTAPAGTLTNGVSLYSSSGDLRFMDSAGNAYSVGFRNVPQSGAAKSSSYTLATTDVGEYINVVSGGSIVIPNATFANGDVITILNNHTATMTITCSITFAYIAGNSTDKATMTLAAAGLATILFIGSTECVVSGNVT